MMQTNRRNTRFWLPSLMLAFFLVSIGSAQTETPAGAGETKDEKPEVQETAPVQTAAVPAPAITSLGGVSLGMSADEARAKLGKADASDKAGMLFTPSGTQSVQIGLDDTGTVRTIAYIYSDGDSAAPSFEDVFGPNVPKPEPGAQLYKMVTYPDAGFWLSYSRSEVGGKPMTVITMRRLN